MSLIIANGNNFETHNLVTKTIRVFSVLILNNLPSSILKKIMKTTSRDAGSVVKHVGSAHAMEIIYTRHHRSLFSRGFFQGLADLFWYNCVSQPKALRNRLKIVEEKLEKEIRNKITNGQKNVGILTIGGGSARAIVHSIDKLLQRENGLNIEITNIDKDLSAIELGKQIAHKFGLLDKFKWVNDSARNISSRIPRNSIDIAEMVGLLDYFSDEKSLETFKQVHQTLKEGGLFIVANIHPNNEMNFVEHIGWPKMYYRKADDLLSLLNQAGFDKEPLLIFEPLRVHIIALVRK